jgi:hypothetical protein
MRLAIAGLLLVCTTSAWSQQYLYLQKGNEIPHTRLELKDKVKFKTTEDGEWLEGILHEIAAERVTVGNATYLLEDITAFRTRNNFVHLLGTTAVAGGTLFTGIFILNGLINGETLLTKNQAILGASLATSGFLVRLLARKTYNRADGWHWEVINLDKDFEQ